MTKRINAIVLVAAFTAALLPALHAQAAQPFGNTGCVGVQPGAAMEGPPGIGYTMGFFFQGKNSKGVKTTYMTSIADHVLAAAGKKTWKAGTGPKVVTGTGKKIGNFVYAVLTDTPAYSTFGLVQIDKGVKVKPQVCHFGGPTGVYTGTDPLPLAIQYYGQGQPINQFSAARTALASGTADKDDVLSQGLFLPGDEGAPVLVNGKILGFSNLGFGGGGAGAGFIVSRIGRWIPMAEKALKIKLKLLTAPAL